MLAPVGSVASAVLGDLRQDEFGGEPAFGEVGGDSLRHFLCWNLGVEKHQHRRTRSAERGAEDTRFSGEFLERGKQRGERRAIRLVDAVFERR